MRTLLIQCALGWDDLRDTQLLVLQPARSDQRSITPLLSQSPSQATLPRLLNLLPQDNNLNALQEGLLNMAINSHSKDFPQPP